jgi:ribosomal protein S18 acetylase RimI-like enzyme
VIRVVPMKRAHVRTCNEMSALSEPWKTLNERIDFKKFIARNEAHVCFDAGVLAGFVIFTPEPVFARGGYLRAIGVTPDLRRQGIGRKLLSFAERMTARHSHHLYLCVSSFNRSAQSFYKRSGYLKVGSVPGLIVQDASEYIYWKRLRPLSRKVRRHNLD